MKTVFSEKKKELKITSVCFLILEAALFAIVLVQTFTNTFAPGFRFAVVVVALLYAILLFAFERKRKNLWLIVAFVFTCAADYFLVLADSHYEMAVSLFVGAQIFHFLRILAIDHSFWKESVLLRLILFGILAICLIFFKMTEPLYLLGAFYILNLCVNAIDSALKAKKKPGFWVLFAGLILFIFCDITVGLYGIYDTLGLSQEVAYAISDLTYIFYIPSQILIPLSALFL